MSRRESAGLLLYRRRNGDVEVLLAHPGGPFWRRRDDGAWTIPKGEIEAGEHRLAAARREFEEETGYRPRGEAQSLGSIRQSGGKVVHVWAIEEDWQPSNLVSNTFDIEWPPRSGQHSAFPELDRAQWFDLPAARVKILKGQAELLDRLSSMLASRE